MTLPDNGVPFPGPEVRNFKVKWQLSNKYNLPGQTIAFKATYSSLTNTPPTLAEVDIDGVRYNMTSRGRSHYSRTCFGGGEAKEDGASCFTVSSSVIEIAQRYTLTSLL